MYEMDHPTVEEEQKEWEYKVIENIKVEYENSNEPAIEAKNGIDVKQESNDSSYIETSDNLYVTNFDLYPSLKCEISSADGPQTFRSSADISAIPYDIQVSLESPLEPDNVIKTNNYFEIDTGKIDYRHLNYENEKSFSINVNFSTTNTNENNENGLLKDKTKLISRKRRGKCKGLLREKVKLKNDSSVRVKKKTGKKSFACNYCDRKFDRNNGLKTHMVTHTGERPFSCNLCDYRCGCKSNLVRHMRIHTGEKPFSCEFCNYRCADKTSLINHRKSGEKCLSHNPYNYKYKKKGLLVGDTIQTDEKPFSCDLCNYKCACKSSLVSHMRTHSGEKPFSCNLCEYKCGHKCSLVRHMTIHTGEKPFSCDLCNRQFGRKNSLIRHKRTHSGEKPYSCSVCNYQCGYKISLVRHMRTHTGEKPFSCEHCDFKCGHQSSLVRHTKTHTAVKSFSCVFCDFKCGRKSSIVNHTKAHKVGKDSTI